MPYQICFESRDAYGQRTALAEWSKTSVDAKYEAVLRHLIQQLDDELRNTTVIAFRINPVDSANLDAVRMQEDEVDIRRIVELIATELAHAQHEKRQHRSTVVDRLAESRFQHRHREADRG